VTRADGRRRPVPDTLFGGRLRDAFLLDLEVATVADLTPRLRSITFRSPDLVDFAWAPGQDVMLDIADGDGDGGRDRDRIVRRRFTIRRTDAAAGTLDIEVVRHGPGPFARWAERAAPGDRVDGLGPRGAVTLRTDAAHHLFVGDDSAIPVTFAMLEQLPPDATGAAVLVTEEASLPPLPSPGAHAIVWIREEHLADHLASIDLPAGTFAYVNGEFSLVRRAADVLRGKGLDEGAISVKPYWRRDQANAPHGEPSKD
jgi:NADPH-dependent ferric siderophore reductase